MFSQVLQNVSDSLYRCTVSTGDGCKEGDRGVIPFSPLPPLINELIQGLGNGLIYRSSQMKDVVKRDGQATR